MATSPYVLQSPRPQNGIYGYNPYPYGGFDPNANDGKGNGVNTSQAKGFTPGGNEAVVDPNAPMENIFAANRDTINTTGNTIGQEAGNQLNYYGGVQTGYQGAQDKALNDLSATPGYTDAESADVRGDPNAPASTMREGIAKESDAVGRYKSNVNGALDQYGNNLSGQVAQANTWTGDAAHQFKAGVGGAAQGLNQGLSDAQQKFGKLDSAVNNPALGFDPNGTEKQLSNSDVQDMVTANGTTVGNQFRTAEDTLERQGAASGNSNPLALAAARQQLVTQEGATAGDAATTARIAALNAQYGRAAGIEQQREGAVTNQAGLKATAATTEEAAAQAAAQTGGQANIGAQTAIANNTQHVADAAAGRGIDAANTYGQFSTGAQGDIGKTDVAQQNTQTNQGYSAGSTAEQQAAARGKTVADQRITGNGQYRSGVAQQQGLAQQGGQAAQQTQTNAYGTQTSGGNAAASGQAGFEVGKASLGDKLGSSVATLFEKGTTGVEEPTYAKVGEHGPEWIGNPAMMREGRYRSTRQMDDEDGQFRMAA